MKVTRDVCYCGRVVGDWTAQKFPDYHTCSFHHRTLRLLPSLSLSYCISLTKMDAPWAHSAQQVLQHFDVNPELGLSNSQVEKHVKVYGKNGMRPIRPICTPLTHIPC